MSGGRGAPTWAVRDSQGDIPSPIEQRIWTGYEEFRCFDTKRLLVDSTTAQAHQKAVKAAFGDGSCAQLAVAAHSSNEWLQKQLEEKWDHTLTEGAFYAYLRVWAKRMQVRFVVHDVLPGDESRYLSTGQCIGEDHAQRKHLLRVRALQADGTVGFHVLPLQCPSYGLHPILGSGAQLPGPYPEEPRPAKVEAKKEEPAAKGKEQAAKVDIATSSREALETPSASPGATRPVVEEARERTNNLEVWVEVQSCSERSGFYLARGLGGYGKYIPQAYSPARPGETGMEPHGEYVEIFGNRVWISEPPLRYHGVYAPPTEMEWVGGWWPSVDGAGQKVGTWLPAFKMMADVRSACLESLDRLDAVYYLPYSPVHGLTVKGCRTLTDGTRATMLFEEGDVVASEGHHFRVEKVRVREFDLLQLVSMRPKAIATLSRWARVIRAPRSIAIEPKLPAALPVDLKNRLEWTVAMQVAPEPELAPLGVLRSQAAKLQFDGTTVGPWEVGHALRVIRQSTASASVPFGYAGGKPYAWGYCYSCGKSLPGSMPGRLCGCPQTGAARSVAEGWHVAAHGRPCYPGVVETMSRHPPLKKGKETMATPSVFRVPPLDVSSWECCRPGRGVARASEGSV
jgi:hypothetical protein